MSDAPLIDEMHKLSNDIIGMLEGHSPDVAMTAIGIAMTSAAMAKASGDLEAAIEAIGICASAMEGTMRWNAGRVFQ